MDAVSVAAAPAAVTQVAAAQVGTSTETSVAGSGTAAPATTFFGGLLEQTMQATQAVQTSGAFLSSTYQQLPVSEEIDGSNNLQLGEDHVEVDSLTLAQAQLALLQSMFATQPVQVASVEMADTAKILPKETVKVEMPAAGNAQLALASLPTVAEAEMFKAAATDGEKTIAVSSMMTKPENQVQEQAAAADLLKKLEGVQVKQETPSSMVGKPQMPVSELPVQAEGPLRQSFAKQEQNAQIVLAETAMTKTQSEVQNAKTGQAVSAEMQPLPQEFSAATKVTTTAVAQPVRFAQPTDVMVATTDMSGQKDSGTNQENLGSQSMAKIVKTMAVAPDSMASEIVMEPVEAKPASQNLMSLQGGQKTAVAPENMPSEPVQPAVAEQLGRQVADKLARHEIKPGNDQITLRLSPENLGNIQLNMRMEDQRMKVEIVAESREVRDALLQQKDVLKETLARQNIQMDSFNVTTGNTGGNQQQAKDWRQMQAEQNQTQQQYAAKRNTAAGFGGFESPMNYFAPQYQSTLDVRF